MLKKKMVKSSVIVIILIILGKVFALVRDSLIAAKFGATYITDVYNFALGMVYLLTTISYGLTTTFIPLHTEHLQKSSKKTRDRFVNNVINISLIVTVVVTVILIIFAKYIIYIFGHGFINDPNIFAMSVDITRIMLLSLIFISLQSVITGVLQSHNEFYEPAAMAMVSNIIYIVYLVLLTSKFGIKGFAVATVVGFFMQFVINIPKYRKLGYGYKGIMDFKDKELHHMFKIMVPIIISTSVVQLNVFVNRSFATNIFSGAVTILDCANKINTLAYEVFAIGIAMIIYPTLSELAAKEDKIQYVKALKTGINIIILIMIPTAVAIAVLREPLINIIFKRGAFSNDASILTASALLFYCPAMISYGIRDILNKAFYSIKDTKTPMINSFIGILINIIINILLVRSMGVSGLTLGTTLSSVIATAAMLVNLNKKIGNIGLNQILKIILKTSIASAVMGVSIFFVNKICAALIVSQLKASLAALAISFILGLTVYSLCIYILKIEEFIYIISLIKQKMKISKV